MIIIKSGKKFRSNSLFKSCSLSEQIDFLLSGFNFILPESRDIIDNLYYKLSFILNSAFKDKNPIALLEIHKTLYKLYKKTFSKSTFPIYLHKDSDWLLKIRNEIEKEWLNYELSDIKKCLPNKIEAENSELLCSWFIEQSSLETDTDKRLINYLIHEASIKEFNTFILSDAPLNNQFLNILELAQLHSSSVIESEISNVVVAEINRNILDECGHGVPDRSHAEQFSRMLVKIDLKQPSIPIWEDWRPYAGFNLHFCLGLNQKYYFESLGSLAMPELFDPNRNRAVVQGLERLFSDPRLKCEFFYNHIEMEEDHGTGWLDNVITPIVELQPMHGMRMAIGGALRMQAMRRYNEYLAARFGLD
jgi:hypothetical protein